MHSLKHFEPDRFILIGASTGGPGHIRKIVEALPPGFSATIIIAQHIGSEYIESFTSRLNTYTQADVITVENDMAVESGKIYVCTNLTLLNPGPGRLHFQQTSGDLGRFNPDIDQLFESASALTNKFNIMGIILTGIGDDGARGCKSLSDAGAKCIAESEHTAVVYGMPLQAKLMIDRIAVQSLDEINLSIRSFVS